MNQSLMLLNKRGKKETIFVFWDLNNRGWKCEDLMKVIDRLSILEKELARLAKMDEARQAAKNGLEQRVEKERDELETKVEERVLKAEQNRMLLFKAMAQRRAAKRQRAAQSLMQKAIQEKRYKESVRAAIYQKRAAAESKRMGILEAERRRANARLTRVFGAASSVQNQKEAERRKMKDRLEERLQRVC